MAGSCPAMTPFSSRPTPCAPQAQSETAETAEGCAEDAERWSRHALRSLRDLCVLCGSIGADAPMQVGAYAFTNRSAQRGFLRFLCAPRCQAAAAISGATVVASANTICSQVTTTLPQEQASLRVEDEQAPSRTSATVIWMAYLCMSTSWPRISAQTTVSWAKFFGTPPPTMKRPVAPAFSLISVRL